MVMVDGLMQGIKQVLLHPPWPPAVQHNQPDTLGQATCRGEQRSINPFTNETLRYRPGKAQPSIGGEHADRCRGEAHRHQALTVIFNRRAAQLFPAGS